MLSLSWRYKSHDPKGAANFHSMLAFGSEMHITCRTALWHISVSGCAPDLGTTHSVWSWCSCTQPTGYLCVKEGGFDPLDEWQVCRFTFNYWIKSSFGSECTSPTTLGQLRPFVARTLWGTESLCAACLWTDVLAVWYWDGGKALKLKKLKHRVLHSLQ